jgi:hypothetical protein
MNHTAETGLTLEQVQPHLDRRTTLNLETKLEGKYGKQ